MLINVMSLETWFSNLRAPQIHLKGLLKHRLLGISEFLMHFGWGSIICVSNQFPGDAVAAGLGTALGELLF